MAYRFGNPYTLALLLAAGVLFALAAVTLRHRRKRAGRAFFVFLVGIGLWALADAMRYAALDVSAVLLWNRIGYLGIVAIPPSLLLFVFAYTGRERWFKRRPLAVLIAISVAAYLTVLTNPIHGLWFEIAALSPGTTPPVLQEDWGLAWYGWAVYSYAVVGTVTYLMTREFLIAGRAGTHRGQTGLILLGLLVAVAVNALFIFDVVDFDPAPFVFSFTGLCFAVAVFRYEFLTLLPIARDTVVRNVDSGILVFDSEDRLVDLNARAQADLDLAPAVAIGASAAEVFGDYPGLRDRLAAADSDGPVEIRVNGETRYYDLEVSALSDALDTAVGRVVVLTDITERVNRRRQLQERTARLERTNERLDEFASVVSHDLRNPLNVITGRLDLVREQDDPERHLEAIEDAAGRMEALIEDLLTLAREGRAVGATESVDLDALVEDTWRMAGSDAARLSSETTATIQADPARLREALGNLFRNSVEHGARAPDGGATSDPRVLVRVGDLEDGFFVQDDGPGIPDDDRDEVLRRAIRRVRTAPGSG